MRGERECRPRPDPVCTLPEPTIRAGVRALREAVEAARA
jgi:hypothetical protein